MPPTVVSEPTEQQPQAKPFDSKAFITARNEGKAAPAPAAATPGKPEEKKPEEKKPDAAAAPPAAAAAVPDKEPDDKGDGQPPRMSRSQRREVNRLLRELGEETGRRKALEEMLSKQGTAAAPAEGAAADESDPETKQQDFKDWDTYSKASTQWAARQETRKVLTSDKQQTE